jgi:excisionase family DNA binding protein
MTDHPKTLSVPEAAEQLGVGRNAAYEAAKRGEIPVIRIGRLLRVPVIALERMLASAGPRSGA